MKAFDRAIGLPGAKDIFECNDQLMTNRQWRML